MKPRDERISVMMVARMLHAGTWCDVSIRNISRRGMMMWSDRPPAKGSYIEVRRAAGVVVARIVWVKGHLFGVRTQDMLDVREMLDGSPIAPRKFEDGRTDRRRASRPPPLQPGNSRLLGRRMQFASVVLFVALAAGFAAVTVATALRAPLDKVATALIKAD